MDLIGTNKNMIFDIFSFFNEITLLEIRLNELHNVVDYFVLVEADVTHSGKPKPFYYHENKHLFRDFQKQIIHIIVHLPTTKKEIRSVLATENYEWIESDFQREDNWVRERYQRNAAMRGLEIAAPDDLIIIDDADEIVRSSVVEQIKSMNIDRSVAVNQSFYHGFLNLKCANMPWWGSKIVKKKFITTLSEERFHTTHPIGIQDGGWHFGFLGDANAIRLKIKSYAHSEFNRPKILAPGWIEGQLNARKDVFGRDYRYEVVPIDETYPKHILDNLYKFDHLICK